MGDGVGSLAGAHRRGNRHEPAEAFRQAEEIRDRSVLSVGLGGVHHGSSDPRGWRLGGGRVDRALQAWLTRSRWRPGRSSLLPLHQRGIRSSGTLIETVWYAQGWHGWR